MSIELFKNLDIENEKNLIEGGVKSKKQLDLYDPYKYFFLVH